MPEAVEKCVSSLVGDWKSGKKKKPTRYKSGDKWKPIKDDKDLESAAWGICQASVGAEVDIETIELEEVEEVPFDNPVMTGVGVTIKPHIMGLDPLSVYEQGEETWTKIPILLLGRWLHRNGILNFTMETVAKLKAALQSGAAGHEIAVDSRHESKNGAVGWIKDLVTERRADGKEQVSVLARLTKWGKDLLSDDRFKYGSIEFHPNFKPRMVGASSALEFDEGVFFQLEEGEVPLTASWPNTQASANGAQEETMPDDKKPDTDQATAISMEQFEQYKLEQQKALQEMEQRLEAERNRATSLEQFAIRQFVDAIVAKAESYRDSEGRAHGKYFLEWLDSVLMCKQSGEGDEVIKLEADAGIEDVHAYYRRRIAQLSLEMPGTVPMTPAQTEPSSVRKLEQDTEEKERRAAEAEVLALLGKAPKGEEE